MEKDGGCLGTCEDTQPAGVVTATSKGKRKTANITRCMLKGSIRQGQTCCRRTNAGPGGGWRGDEHGAEAKAAPGEEERKGPDAEAGTATTPAATGLRTATATAAAVFAVFAAAAATLDAATLVVSANRRGSN